MIAVVAKKASELAGIIIYPRDVERVIGALMASSQFWHVVYYSRLPSNAVAGIIKELIDLEMVAVEGKLLRLLPKGWEEAWKENIEIIEDRTCKACGGRGIDLGPFENLLVKFNEIVKNRPKAIMEYDQGYVTSQTTVARIALLSAKGDIKGKDIIILGDDDLVSIAAALSGLPRRIIVLEIDPRLIYFISEVATAHNLSIEVVERDIRKQLPEEFFHKFDTFLTDPPETLSALELFIARGLSTLKGPRCAGYFGLTYAESSLEKWLGLQQLLSGKFKVAITDIIHNFNEYMNWDYLLESLRKDLSFILVEPAFNWYRSSMYRIETLENIYKENLDTFNVELYMDKEALDYKGKLGKNF